jgi:dolichyl-phosphate-mannose--protein O-mannosyl transferase
MRPPTRRLRAAAARLRALASRATRLTRRLLADPLAATVLLCLILVFSLYARVLDLGQPCTSPCKDSSNHTLIFDESYYVNAARVIDGIEPPVGAPYHGAPKYEDPNAEHPQLAKLVIAGGIELFGDNPRGWRIGSVLFGLLAMVALYVLVQAAGGSAWLALGAVGVMSLDNLLLVGGRIATLDIYAVAMMLVAAALYMRRHPLLAGVALGVGGCMKEVALYLIFVVVLLEALRYARLGWARWAAGSEALAAEGAPGEVGAPTGEASLATAASATPRASDASSHSTALPTGQVGNGWRALLLFLAATTASFLGLLWLLDVLVPAYDPVHHTTYAGSPFTHLLHIYHYAQQLKMKPGEVGISSSPWEWLLNERTINYAKVAVNSVVNGHLVASRATVAFQGAINPFIIFMAIPALFAALAAAWRKGEGVAAVGACWCVGAFMPFAVDSFVTGRISYIYYMVVVMPGVYIVAARLFSPRRMPLAATLGWTVALVYGFLNLYPLHTLL